jgi:hypothetical protein
MEWLLLLVFSIAVWIPFLPQDNIPVPIRLFGIFCLLLLILAWIFIGFGDSYYD